MHAHGGHHSGINSKWSVGKSIHTLTERIGEYDTSI